MSTSPTFLNHFASLLLGTLWYTDVHVNVSIHTDSSAGVP